VRVQRHGLLLMLPQPLARHHLQLAQQWGWEFVIYNVDATVNAIRRNDCVDDIYKHTAKTHGQ